MYILSNSDSGEIMKLSTFIVYILIFVAVLTILARFLPVPFALFTVVSGSMEPSIRPLDTGIAIATNYNVGDVVVWCTTPWYCVMHRVRNMTSSYIITRGDANPLQDPPIPKNLVRGKVVLVIQREFWLPIVIALIAFVSYTYRKQILPLFTPTIILPVGYILFTFFLLGFVATQTGLTINIPYISLSRSHIVDNSSICVVNIKYYEKDIELKNVTTVKIFNITATSQVKFTNDTISIVIPEDIAMLAANNGLTLNLSIEANLRRGAVLKGSYSIPLVMQDPKIYIANDTLIIENPNCYPMKFNITWIYANTGEPWKHLNTLATIKNGKAIFKPPVNASNIYVDIRYLQMGTEFYERLRVR
jgi:signal peptidase I